MTVRECKEWLMQFRSAKRYAEQCSRDLNEIRHSQLRSPRLDYTPRRNAPSSLDYAVERIEIAEKALNKAKAKADALLLEVEDAISELEDFDQAQVLRCRFIKGMKWIDVADELFMAESTTRKKCDLAIIELAKIRSRKESND